MAGIIESRQFRLAYGVSGFYLGALFILLIASLSTNQLSVQTLDSSSIWLVSIQGICSTVLSVFHIRAASAPAAKAD